MCARSGKLSPLFAPISCEPLRTQAHLLQSAHHVRWIWCADALFQRLEPRKSNSLKLTSPLQVLTGWTEGKCCAWDAWPIMWLWSRTPKFHNIRTKWMSNCTCTFRCCSDVTVRGRKIEEPVPGVSLSTLTWATRSSREHLRTAQYCGCRRTTLQYLHIVQRSGQLTRLHQQTFDAEPCHRR